MAAPPPATTGGGNILTQRLGPLATWVWLLIATIGIGAIVLWQKHKGGTTATAQAQPGQTAGVQDVPDIILQNYTTQTQTDTDTAPPTTTKPPPVVTPPHVPGPPIKKPPGPPKPPPKYRTITVAKWTKTNTPWNSTLWGIATHFKVKGGYQALAKLNGIKDPDLIYPGQKIKVPE